MLLFLTILTIDESSGFYYFKNFYFCLLTFSMTGSFFYGGFKEDFCTGILAGTLSCFERETFEAFYFLSFDKLSFNNPFLYG